LTDATTIEITGVYKVYGNIERALRQLELGKDKAFILKEYGDVVALNNVNLVVSRGEVFVVMGLSGSGKSTLIRMVNALIEPSRGEIVVAGRDILKLNASELQRFRAHHISMVFQHFGLLPHKTVLHNVMYGLRIQGMSKSGANSRAAHWIEQVGLKGFETRYPGSLSGGMQQRVGLARALATDSEIILMDEAFSALDPLIRHEMQALLLDLQARLRKTIVFITHDLDEALHLGDRIAILSEGNVIQIGAPLEILTRPANRFIHDFVSSVNRARALRVENVMIPCPAERARQFDTFRPRISRRDTLQTVFPYIFDTPDVLPVFDDAGAVVGLLDPRSMVKAVKPPEK
jgi:glycine betaine/proline transport system ATP-binding protein